MPAVGAEFAPLPLPGLGGVDGVSAVTRIDQVIPTLASRDAIGGHVMQLRDLLRSRGYDSDIFYGNASPDRLDEGFPITRIGDPSSAGRVLLYQLSIGSGVADIFRDRPERKFVNYHNITPADLLEAWIPAVGEEVRWGRAQLRDLAKVTEFAIADSVFNETELRDAGYPSTTTVPLLIDPEDFTGSPDPALAARLARQRAGGGADLLFVGKVSPHKGQHDLVKALAAYRRLYDPKARLHIVGGAISEEYQQAVERFADELGPDRRRRVRPARSPTRSSSPTTTAATSSSACPTTRASACRCSSRCTTGCPSSSWRVHGRARDGGPGRADPARQGAGPGGRGHPPGGRATPGCAPSWPRRPPSGSTGSPCRGSRTGSSPPSRPPARRDARPIDLRPVRGPSGDRSPP